MSTNARARAAWYRRPGPQILLVLILLALACAGGWALAEAFESPEQRAADASPPPPGPITVAVREGPLTSSVNLRTTIALADEATLKVTKVVTRVVTAPGAEVPPGGVILEVEGAPVFVLEGAFPFYRDLTTNAEGPDVVQLQEGLSAAGFDVAATGRYDWDTIVAVAQLYRRAGFDGYDGRTFVAANVIVVSSLPGRVVAVPPVGAPVSGSDEVKVSSGTPVATGALSQDMEPLITVGLEGELTLDSGLKLKATVSSSTSPATQGENAIITFDLLSNDGSAIDPALVGTGGVVSIALATVAEKGLLVPTSAISHAEDGTATVLKKASDGSFLRVPVQELGELDGVTALSSDNDELKAGDLVRTG